MGWLNIFENMLWFGLAATGFAVLFNVPPRSLPLIFVAGALAGCARMVAVGLGANIVVASLCGASLIGFISIPFAHYKHVPPLVFSIPSVIPLVPGVLAFKMMRGLITLAGDTTNDIFITTLADTISSGIKMMFILLCLAGGVAFPMLLSRKQSVKHVRLISLRKKD